MAELAAWHAGAAGMLDRMKRYMSSIPGASPQRDNGALPSTPVATPSGKLSPLLFLSPLCRSAHPHQHMVMMDDFSPSA